MPACYFNSDSENVYSCEYKLVDGYIEIDVDYEIMDEIKAVNGVKTYNGNTKFTDRDIVIVDYHNKTNYLAKRAWFSGTSRTMGTLDGGVKAKFRTNVFFEHNNVDKLKELPATPKVTRIQVYSKSIIDWIGNPSLSEIRCPDALTYRLAKSNECSTVLVESKQLRQIGVADSWLATHDGYSIAIDFVGYIELELIKRVNYDEVYEFVYELMVYMQLYCPDRFKIEEIRVMVNDSFYILNLPLPELKYKETRALKTVEADLLDFLKKCYLEIPFRKSRQDIRNIPHIVLKTSRSIEDNFLMFYRFIECYYKRNQIAEQSSFISASIRDFYACKHDLSPEQIENYSQEIICLRNHYVHAGYYFQNDHLRITFEKKGEEASPKNYTVNNIDVQWIYERTKILYGIAIDIIYTKMLGYDRHSYVRHF